MLSFLSGPGLRLAVSVLTVVPFRATVVDRSAAAVAMTVAPAVGAVLGLAVGAIGVATVALGGPPAVGAVLVVAASIALTRGLHIDGLADTVDALGSYADRDAALAIMRKPDVGPFGVAAIVLVLAAQIAAATAVLMRPGYAALASVAAALAAGRLGIALACRRGVPAARPDGLGALVAGTVGRPALAVAGLAVAALAVVAVPGRPWQGPLAVAASVVAAVVVRRHAVRRLGGVTGDVLGAVCELSASVTYVVVSM